MQNTLKAMALCAAVFGAGAQGSGAALAQTMGQTAGQITVIGTGVINAPPDMATLSLGVTSLAQSATKAFEENNIAMKSVIARLTQAGIAPRDLQTSDLQIFPNWVQTDDAQTPQINGYTASHMLTAHVRDLASLGQMLDAAVQDGANTLQGVSFGIANPAPIEEAARSAAVQDAQTRASAMLAAAQADLGRIISITENSNLSQPMPMLRMAAQDSAVPTAAGELGISAQVSVVFEIIQ